MSFQNSKKYNKIGFLTKTKTNAILIGQIEIEGKFYKIMGRVNASEQKINKKEDITILEINE